MKPMIGLFGSSLNDRSMKSMVDEYSSEAQIARWLHLASLKAVLCNHQKSDRLTGGSFRCTARLQDMGTIFGTYINGGSRWCWRDGGADIIEIALI